MGRASLVLRIVESASSRVRIRREVVDVEAFVDAHHAAVAVACVVEGAVCVATDGATAVGEFATSVRLVWLVQGVRVVVSRLLSASTDCSMITTIIVDDIAAARADGGEVANVERAVVHAAAAAAHVAVDRLLARVVTAAVVEPSLVELIGSNLTKGILIFCCSSAKVATVALMDWITRAARRSLLSQLGLCNRLRYRVAIRVVSTGTCWTWEHDIVATLIEKLRCHHHLLLLACVCVWCLSLIHQVKQVCLVGSILVADAARGADSIVTH